jgi:hypothetical protein
LRNTVDPQDTVGTYVGDEPGTIVEERANTPPSVNELLKVWKATVALVASSFIAIAGVYECHPVPIGSNMSAEACQY